MVDPRMERLERHLTRLNLVSTRERLNGLLEAGAKGEMSFLEFLDHIIRKEVRNKDQRRAQLRIQMAKFPLDRRVESYDFSLQPSLDRRLITELETGRYLANATNVLLLGPPGVGKTHLDIGLVGHCATGIRHRKNHKAGYQVLHVCNDDHTRACYMEMLPDETKGTTASFLQRALLHFQAQGITIRKLLTDNGSPYRSKEFKAMREAFGLKHARTRPYRPRTNEKAERLIQSALQEWDYGPTWQSSDERNQALIAWLHFYNHHRPHLALGDQPPVTKLNNLVGNDN